jgi:hypothetical protein
MAGRQVTGWLQISGDVFALRAVRGEEEGSWLWITAGRHNETVVSELYLPAVSPDALDGAMGIATGTVQRGGETRSGDVRLEFGRVSGGHGVVTATGELLDADIRFALRRHPPDGGFCPHCGSALDVQVVKVITPPDGGVMGSPQATCRECGRA